MGAHERSEGRASRVESETIGTCVALGVPGDTARGTYPTGALRSVASSGGTLNGDLRFMADAESSWGRVASEERRV